MHHSGSDLLTLIIRCKKVVFPAPRKPDIMVIGILPTFLSLLPLLEMEEEEEVEVDVAIAKDCKTLDKRFPPARTEGAIIEVTNYNSLLVHFIVEERKMRKERVFEVGMFEVLEAVFLNYHWYKEQERNLPPKHRRITTSRKTKSEINR